MVGNSGRESIFGSPRLSLAAAVCDGRTGPASHVDLAGGAPAPHAAPAVANPARGGGVGP
eukprot:8367679-Alexandrium_andersonii.AAC.1